MLALVTIDFVVIAVYFVVMIGIGIWSMRRIKNQEDYFLAGRRFGKFIQTFATFGQATSADTCVGVTTTTFTNGASGTWSSLIYLFATPMYWLVMPWMRRLRLMTLGDYFEERYGSKAMAGVYAILGPFSILLILAVGFSAMTKTIVALAPKPVDKLTAVEKAEYDQALTLERLQSADYKSLSPEEQNQLKQLRQMKPRKLFSYINKDILIWTVCIIVMIYAVAGGLEAAFLTDTIQGVFIILLSVTLFPFAFAKINTIYGGSGVMDALRAVHRQLPESFFEVFGSPHTVDFTWYYILAVSFMGAINVVIQPNAIIVNGSAKDEYACRFGFVTGSFMKRFCSVFWGFFALISIALYYNKVNDPDLVWGYATLDLLGSLNIGLVGLMIACLMAALMSTADCIMITCSSLITHNLYRPIFPDKSEKHYIFVGRIIGALVVIFAALLAGWFDSIFQILKIMWETNVMVAAAFWVGMKWRRANKTGAWASIIFTSLAFYVLPILATAVVPSLYTHPNLLKKTHPEPITISYTAREMDVQIRQAKINTWQALPDEQKQGTPCPEPLAVGETFEKTYYPPEKSIFWSKGIKIDDQGNESGSGLLSFELILLDKLGVDLANKPFALNETIRILIRTFTPFIILILVATFTRPDNKEQLDRFYVKMKTPVIADRKLDDAELEKSYADPHRFDHKKLFSRSNWEFDKWDRQDVVGFVLACLAVGAVVCTLKLLTSLGG